MLKNYMEDLVELYLPRVLRDNAEKYGGICRCPACTALVQVEALNGLKPFYVTGKAGEVFGEYHSKNLQEQADLIAAITRAIETASAHLHQVGDPNFVGNSSGMAKGVNYGGNT